MAIWKSKLLNFTEEYGEGNHMKDFERFAKEGRKVGFERSP